MTKLPYNELALVPEIIAEAVCNTVYTGNEYSNQSGVKIAKIEMWRKKMTEEQKQAFINLCDMRCRGAYDIDAEWFMKCVNSDNGNDQLMIWLTHWLSAYLFKINH